MVEELNQDIFFDDQNYHIDIDKVYNDFIKEIDEIRSHTILSNLGSALDVDNSGIKLSEDSNPQESRCNAFYRLIGLPIISPNGGSYNPGYDRDSNKSEDLNRKKSIAGEISRDLINFMNFRELDNVTTNHLFSLQNIESSVLALSSLNIRRFVDPLSKGSGDPFSTIDPTYSLANENLFGAAIFASELSLYVDEDGTQISPNSPALGYAKTRRHRLKPFMVNPIIDLTIRPAKNFICTPFVIDKSATLISNDVYVRRPFIEFVCRARFDGTNKLNTLTPAQQGVIDNIKNSESFKDSKIIQEINQGVGKVTETSQFINLFNIMRTMIDKLKTSRNIIDETRSDFLWVPIPNKDGPEFGSTTRAIVPNDPNISQVRYEKDNEIVQKQSKKRFEEITRSVLANTKVDIGNFSFQSIQIAPDNSEGLGNNNSNDLDQLLSKRNEQCNKANDALREIEIIMGEFSGLGLCDIIAIYGALWLIEKKELIGLLDDNAFNRMKKVKELKEDPALAERVSATAAITAFENKVKELFELMDKIYDDATQKNNNVYTSQ